MKIMPQVLKVILTASLISIFNLLKMIYSITQ